ncbi:MAG: DUF364 domain-containing protein [Pseudomonadota bacterium]|nr:DUF364 domain-containing protein [Pseudomonadota bacterium]
MSQNQGKNRGKNQKEMTDFILSQFDTIPDQPVTRLTYGAHIVAVESRSMGLATWASEKHPVPIEDLPDPGQTVSVKELAQLLHDDNPLKSSLGLAALNSLLPDPAPEDLADLNAGDLIMDLGKEKKVAVIGHFPFVARMQGCFKEFMVFEKKPQSRDLAADLIPQHLPSADIVAITATTVSNKTLARILSHCSSSATKLILGPSTPLSPALFELGFDYIAGTVVKDKDLARQGIENGLAFKHLQGVKHVILSADNYRYQPTR